MSLTKVSLGSVVKKQYLFKLKAYSGVFTTLVVLQLIGIFFSSLGGSGSSSTSNDRMSISFEFYSADIMVAFTILWGFIIAIRLTTKVFKDDDFTFVTNRVTHNISNALFLLTASIVAGITAILSGYLVKLIAVYIIKIDKVMDITSAVPFKEVLIGILATALYVLLFSALGYLIGEIIQLHRYLVVIVPVCIIGSFFIGFEDSRWITPLSGYFFLETSILLFLLKVIITSALLFCAAAFVSNRVEVKQ